MRKRLKKILIVAGITLVVLSLAVFITLKFTLWQQFPLLENQPQIGKWYEVQAVEGLCGNGDPWHGCSAKERIISSSSISSEEE